MQLAKLLKLLTFLAVLAFVMSAAAQQIRYEDFSNDLTYNLLDRNGTATRGTWNGITVLRLTQGSSASRRAQGVQASSVWFQIPQPLSSGFTSYFRFVIHNPVNCCAPGDGLAFVMQSSSYTDASLCASGAQGTAIGNAPGGLGYTGIPNSVAIEFDTHLDAWDPNANHVALQSCGANPNNPVHDSGEYAICSNNHVTSCPLSVVGTTIPPLGVTCGDGGCIDGIPVTVVVEYTGTSQNDPNHLMVYVDPLLIPGTHTPVAQCPEANRYTRLHDRKGNSDQPDRQWRNGFGGLHRQPGQQQPNHRRDLLGVHSAHADPDSRSISTTTVRKISLTSETMFTASHTLTTASMEALT